MTTKQEKALSAKDIAVILKACAETGASQLRFGQLEITFGERKVNSSTSDQVLTSFDTFVESPITSSPPSEHEENSQPSESDLEILQITNPAAWEEYVTQDKPVNG